MKKSTLYYVWKSSFEGQNETLVIDRFNWLIQQYQEKSRYYHNLGHIQHLITQINDLALIERDRRILIYSAFYHDVFYEINNQLNEVKSAKIAVKQLTGLGVEVSIIKAVERTILATIDHRCNNELTQLFLDMDLAILASNEIKYTKYKKAIRKENACFIAPLFNLGRKQFIKSLLNKSRIFLTDLYHSKYEVLARKNLIAELKSL